MALQTNTPRLKRELDTYAAHRDELLREAHGKFVLIHGTELAGIYDSQMAAIAAGYGRFGNVPFLVKQIVPVETPLPFSAPLIDA